MSRRSLVSVLAHLDRLPPSPRRWRVEWKVLRAIARVERRERRHQPFVTIRE